MTKIHVHGCGNDYGTTSNEIEIEHGDFMLKVGDKNYRFQIDRDGNLNLRLINGSDCKIICDSGFPAVKLISR